MWRDTFLERELFFYRDVWRGLACIQEIRRDVLSESKEHLNLPVCLLHKWTSDRSDLYLWNMQSCNTKLCLTILWWSIFLVCFIHKDTRHIKYKVQSYRNLKDQLCKSVFPSPPSSKIPVPSPRQHCCWRFKLLPYFSPWPNFIHVNIYLWMVILKHRLSYRDIFSLKIFFLLFSMSSMIMYFSEWPMQLALPRYSGLFNECSQTEPQLLWIVNSWHMPTRCVLTEFKTKFCLCISFPLRVTFKIFHYIDT